MDCGTEMPSTLAVLRLITSSYFVGPCTGRSAGWVPLGYDLHKSQLPDTSNPASRARTRRADLPDGLIYRIRVKPSTEKYFSFSETQSDVWLRRPAPHKGRIAIVTNVERDAM